MPVPEPPTCMDWLEAGLFIGCKRQYLLCHSPAAAAAGPNGGQAAAASAPAGGAGAPTMVSELSTTGSAPVPCLAVCPGSAELLAARDFGTLFFGPGGQPSRKRQLAWGGHLLGLACGELYVVGGGGVLW